MTHSDDDQTVVASDGAEVVEAAGGVLWRDGDAGREYGIIHRPKYDDWTLPKGKLDPGETHGQAALREVAEETGFAAELGPDLGETRYPHRSRTKRVRYWGMRANGGGFERNDEVDTMRWLPLDKACELLTYDHDCDILGRFVAALDATPRTKVGYRQLVDAAEREIETLTADQALDLLDHDDVCFVDVRDRRELEREGRIPGAVHCPRGMLEFWIDPDSPYHKPLFADPKRFVFYCASGWRSALATRTAAEMGLEPVAHIGGGFTAWREAGGDVEQVAART